MTSIRLTCSVSGTATSVPASMTVLGRGSDGVTSLTFPCPACRHVAARVLDALDADELRASHVPCTTADDALDLHLALQRPTWFDELVSAGQDIAGQPIHRSTES